MEIEKDFLTNLMKKNIISIFIDKKEAFNCAKDLAYEIYESDELRKDKFSIMEHEEFNKCIYFSLRNSKNKIVYSCSVRDNKIKGGMTNNIENALNWCNKFYKENPSAELCIGDYSKGVLIWDKTSILHELGYISDKEYDKYLDNIEKEERIWEEK